MKKVFMIVLLITLLTGCKLHQNDNKERIYLSDNYYNEGKFIDLKSDELLDKVNDTYILFTYNSYCNLPISCEDIFKSFAKKYKIDFISISFEEFKNTELYTTVKYAPSVMIIKDNKVLSYLDANSDKDLNKYQDLKEFESWLDNYIYFNKK